MGTRRKKAKLTNGEIAELLRRYAAVRSLAGTDRFKLKAYRRAAETIDGLDVEVVELLERGELTSLPGIGTGLSAIIEEIVSTGTLARLKESTAALTPAQAELARYPALDPKIVSRAYRTLKIDSLAALRASLASGEAGKRLGRRLEFQLRSGLDPRPRVLRWTAEPFANKVLRAIRRLPGVSRAEATGSLRRKQDTVGDLNLLITGTGMAAVFRAISKLPALRSEETVGRNERRYGTALGADISVRWTPENEWGLALLRTTGSAAHLNELEARAAKHRIALTARGLKGKKISSRAENAIYEALGLAPVPPELREGGGEVEAAGRGTLPALVEQADLRGDLHMHTVASDGANTIEEMADAARARGYEYIAITDHSQSLRITNGLTVKRLAAQIRAIEKVNGKLRGFRILKSAEVDILADGELDYPQSILKELDFTICSIHSRFGLNREQQTERILRAMDNRYFNILGHATGRLLLKREGYEIDLERIIAHAAQAGCFFEINSSPDRLDLSDVDARQAMEAGILIAVNTDAHSVNELDFISAGINQARRAWLSAEDVLNTRPLRSLLTLFKR